MLNSFDLLEKQIADAGLHGWSKDFAFQSLSWDDRRLMVVVSEKIRSQLDSYPVGWTIYITTPALVKSGQAVELIEKLVNQLSGD